jgi:hypothetical protein
VIGEGGDIAGYESPWNYNGEPPRTMVDREWREYLAQGEELLERDLLAYRSRLEGVRRKGFWNPGHCINYASGYEKSGRDVLEAWMTVFALPKRSRLTKQEREDRVLRRYMTGYLPEQAAERQEFEKAVAESEGQGEARGFFSTMMNELTLTG